MQDLTRNESRLFQIQHGVDECLLRLPHSPHRLQSGEKLVHLWRMMSVLMTPGETAFTRTPRPAYSMASERGHRIKAAFG